MFLPMFLLKNAAMTGWNRQRLPAFRDGIGGFRRDPLVGPPVTSDSGQVRLVATVQNRQLTARPAAARRFAVR